MVVSVLQAIIYSLLQGIAEWLPISSSAHISILQNIFGTQSFSFLIFLEFASILAAAVMFRKDIVHLFKFKDKETMKYWAFLIVALIPTVIVGFFFRDQIASMFLNLFYIGIFLMVSGIIVYSTKFSKPREGKKMSFVDSAVIGVFQGMAAMFRGITRSGSTISSGMHLGLKREEAVKFSFLIGIAGILGASIFEAKNLVLGNISYSILVLTFVLTFAMSILSIKVLLKIVKSDHFYRFGIYDFILGAAVLIWSLVH